MLAYNIVKANAAGTLPRIALGGLLVGNGCIGDAVGICGSALYGDFLSLSQVRLRTGLLPLPRLQGHTYPLPSSPHHTVSRPWVRVQQGYVCCKRRVRQLDYADSRVQCCGARRSDGGRQRG